MQIILLPLQSCPTFPSKPCPFPHAQPTLSSYTAHRPRVAWAAPPGLTILSKEPPSSSEFLLELFLGALHIPPSIIITLQSNVSPTRRKRLEGRGAACSPVLSTQSLTHN